MRYLEHAPRFKSRPTRPAPPNPTRLLGFARATSNMPHTLMPRPPGRTPPGSVRPPDLARPARSGPPARPSPPVRVRARSVDHDFGHGFYRVRCLLDLIALAAVSVTVTGTATVA